MKKYIGIFIVGCLVLFASSNVYAALNDAAGAEVTITDTATGAVLEFEPSPTTRLGWSTSANAFALVSWSASNEGNDNGYAYCSSSETTNVYKRAMTDGYVPSAAAAAGSTLDGFE